MPDSDSPSSSPADAAPYEPRHLPVPVPPPREGGESWMTRVFRALFGWKPNSRADLKDVLDAMPPGESGFSPEESRMLKNILGLRERRVGDVMIPRADIIAVQQDIKIGELVRTFEGAAHSRLVVYNDTLDDPIGMVHIRDLIAFMTARAAVDPEKNAKRKKPLPAGLDLKAIDLSMPLSAAKIVREILFVPPSSRVIDLLARMQATRIHLSLVVDEYGGSDGLVSIEDIVEQIVGEIADEHDEDELPHVVRQSDDSFIADARAHLEDVAATIGNDFDPGDVAQEVDTLGGYLVTRAGRLPVRGELIPGPGLFEFEVLPAAPRRIKRVRITRLKDKRERPREQRKRGEPDAVLAGTTPPALGVDDAPAQKDGGPSSAGSPAGWPAYPALFTALGLAAARLIWVRGPERVLALAAMLTAAEWLRGHLLSGFPWNTFGYALTEPLALAQSVSLVGILGLTFLCIAICASPAVLADDLADTAHPRRAPFIGVLIPAGLASYGVARLWQHPTAYVSGVKLRIMQPNLQQDEKFNYATKAQVMERYLRLSDRATGPNSNGVHDVTHLIWPESAFPFFLTREPDALAQITALLKPSTELITGAVRAAPTASASNPHAYNSVYVIDPDGSIRGIYDKVHLVPFGEYLPLQRLLERLGLKQLTKMVRGFPSGARRRAMDVPGAPKMLPLICYEAIFPGTAVPSGERPGWLVNVTNDGWFGISSGPYQHFQQARVLAIAEGLPLVRAANTGISAVVDPVGRIVNALPLGAEGVLDSQLPRAIAPTPYVRFGDSALILFMVASLIMIARRRMHP